MNQKIYIILIGGIIGAIALGLCVQSFTGGIIGAVLGGVVGLVVAITQTQMAKDRETGLDS